MKIIFEKKQGKNVFFFILTSEKITALSSTNGVLK